MKKVILLLFIVICFVQASTAQLTLKDAFPALSFTQPIEFTSPDDQTNRIFVASQTGTIHVFPNNPAVNASKVFLNMTARVISGGERGLLGLTFHPDYKNNGFFYVSYNRKSDGLRVISRYKVSAADPDLADLSSELVLLTYVQPFANHNGGKIAFGKDGYLYIATGDGGSSGDPLNNAQNRTVLLGKILRIDVNNTAPNLNYAIPPDNPYVNNTQGFLPEIYAYGLRNPWKFSVDKETGTIWAGDVGQGQREEVDILVKGGNYGWRLMEGNLCYNPAQNCNPGDLISPIHEYDRSASGGVSITGGFVYRGSIPYLYGKYVYGDFGSRNMWALTYNTDRTVSNEFLQKFSGAISAFGEDQFKELYICNYSNGKIYKFTDPIVEAPSNVAAVVSENSVALSWKDNAYNETNFVLERALTAGGPYTVVATLAANTLNFTDINLATVTTYFYRLKAINTETGFNSAYTSPVSATTTKLNQTITFNTLPDRIKGDSAFTISASASSGLPVSFSVVSGPASISSGNLVSISDTGTVTIRAAQPGNETYNAATPIEQRFRVLSTVTSLPNQDNSQFQVNVFPNPVNELLTISFHLPLQAEVSLQLYNSLSIRIVQLINHRKLQSGDHKTRYNMRLFPPGIYLYQLKINDQVILGRIQVSR